MPIRRTDCISHVDGIIIDVTARINLQERLVQAESLKTIREVSARLAHEIRNPLMSAGGFARRLLTSMEDDVEDFFYPFTLSETEYDTTNLPLSKNLINKHGGVIDVCLEDSGELVIDMSLPV